MFCLKRLKIVGGKYKNAAIVIKQATPQLSIA